MTTTAEVVIIGAGISGASVAYHLAVKGLRDIIVIDKENMASGARSLIGDDISDPQGVGEPSLRKCSDVSSVARSGRRRRWLSADR